MSAKQPLFVTGIGTGIGKTVISAILTEKLKADYWKPIQSGDLDNSDTIKVKALITNAITSFHPETYRLTQPFSPHKSAAIDKIIIDPDRFILPKTLNQLVIEGAGGLMVPLTDSFLMIDLIKKLGAEVVLVSQHYLGSINHTLLSALMLQKYQIPIKGIIFNGPNALSSEHYIIQYTKLKRLGHIPQLDKIEQSTITEVAKHLEL